MDVHQSLINHLDDLGVRVHIKRNRMVNRRGFPTGSRHYRVVVSNQSGDSFTAVYSQGPAIKEDPSIFDVLSALMLDYECGGMTFEEFCSDLGYNEDSRKDYDLWASLKRIEADLANVLGGHIESIRDIIQC